MRWPRFVADRPLPASPPASLPAAVAELAALLESAWPDSGCPRSRIVAQAAKGKSAAKTVTKTATQAAAVKPASRSHPPKELKAEPVVELKDEYNPT